MNKLEQYIVGLLQHKLRYEGREVQVRRQFNNIDDLPTVTLDIVGVNTEQVHRTPYCNDLFKECEDNIDTIVYEGTAEITINLWCNTEDERESLSDQIVECFNKEQSGHYEYCTQYDNGVCLSTGEACPAISDLPHVRKCCPAPLLRGYLSLRSSCNIIPGSLDMESPLMMDEFDKHPPLLRNMFRVVAGYYDTYEVGGDILDDISIGEVRIE